MSGIVLDTAGTLELVDTGRRCSVRGVRILMIRCTKKCTGDAGELIHDGILEAWTISKHFGGYHQGCDPSSEWNKDPAASKAAHDAKREEARRQLGEPIGAYVACGTLACSGAAT